MENTNTYICTDFDSLQLQLRVGCMNAQLTARLANRELTATAGLTCGRIARSMVSKPLG